MDKTGNMYNILVGNPEGKRPLTNRWDYTEISVKEMAWVMDEINMYQERDQLPSLENLTSEYGCTISSL
jgi:hypothetical protein